MLFLVVMVCEWVPGTLCSEFWISTFCPRQEAQDVDGMAELLGWIPNMSLLLPPPTEYQPALINFQFVPSLWKASSQTCQMHSLINQLIATSLSAQVRSWVSHIFLNPCDTFTIAPSLRTCGDACRNPSWARYYKHRPSQSINSRSTPNPNPPAATACPHLANIAISVDFDLGLVWIFPDAPGQLGLSGSGPHDVAQLSIDHQATFGTLR